MVALIEIDAVVPHCPDHRIRMDFVRLRFSPKEVWTCEYRELMEGTQRVLQICTQWKSTDNFGVEITWH